MPTNGKPLRGLIQDHVIMGVLLTKRDTFLNRDEYMQLLQLAGMRLPPGARIKTAPPSILAPVRLWTGKQVISTLLHHLHPSARSLNAECAAKTSKGLVGDEEAHVIIRRGELVTGVLDKAAFGDSEFGLVHSVHELLGGEATGALLTQLGKLFTGFQQMHGFTCGIADLLLTPHADAERARILGQATSNPPPYHPPYHPIDPPP